MTMAVDEMDRSLFSQWIAPSKMLFQQKSPSSEGPCVKLIRHCHHTKRCRGKANWLLVSESAKKNRRVCCVYEREKRFIICKKFGRNMKKFSGPEGLFEATVNRCGGMFTGDLRRGLVTSCRF
mmetsp:Transcript_8745/g.21347  ORF Transcript_8745/g.21347 Transcript_8745/m.21347 type:complete len:123 (-) Transcript_8745:996-1364(-)